MHLHHPRRHPRRVGFVYVGDGTAGVLLVKRDLLKMKTDEQRTQDRMAANISTLKSKKAKKQQAHLLVRSLVAMIRGK